MIYDTNDDKTPFKNVASGANFTNEGQLYLKVLNPEGNVNVVNLCTGRLWYFGCDVNVKVVKVKIVDVK